MMPLRPTVFALALAALVAVMPASAKAQAPAAPPAATATPAAAAPAAPGAATATPADPANPSDPAAAPVVLPGGLTEEILQQPFKGSLFFTPLEITSILSATSGKPVAPSVMNTQNVTNIPLKRTIRLSGVLYRKPDDWIVWLNGRKVVPWQWLPEIVDIRVEKDQVHLKWFDIGMAKIITLTLRPHQTYDVVTGLLLPG